MKIILWRYKYNNNTDLDMQFFICCECRGCDLSVLIIPIQPFCLIIIMFVVSNGANMFRNSNRSYRPNRRHRKYHVESSPCPIQSHTIATPASQLHDTPHGQQNLQSWRRQRGTGRTMEKIKLFLESRIKIQLFTPRLVSVIMT